MYYTLCIIHEVNMVVIDKQKYLNIKARMIELELTQKDIANKINTTREHVSLVIRGLSSSPRIRHAIESILGEPIWSTPTTSEPDPIGVNLRLNLNSVNSLQE